MAAPSAITLILERGAQIGREFRVHAEAALIFPLGDAVVTLDLGNAPASRLDRASYALVPAGARHRVRAESPVAEVVTLTLTSRARDGFAREYRGDMDADRFLELLAKPRVLPRTRWVDELVHRYVFERLVCEKPESQAARFLEVELTKELYFACLEREENKTRASIIDGESDAIKLACAFVDEQIASPFKMSELAGHCHMSSSSLLRAFQKELKTTPAAFARRRKMDAAHLLLESKKYTVGEVAARVGYGNLGAFTTAFRKQFGAPPTSISRADSELERLPPHGKPPRTRRKRRNV